MKNDLEILINWNDKITFNVKSEDVSFDDLQVKFEELCIDVRDGLQEAIDKTSATHDTKFSGKLLVSVKHYEVWLIKCQAKDVSIYNLAKEFYSMTFTMQRAIDQIKQGKKNELDSNVKGIRDKENKLDGKWLEDDEGEILK